MEVQVASVLMHAWAEVEHDLVYKPYQGLLSEDEYAILDELNGMVMAGEIAFLVTSAQQYDPFTIVLDLGSLSRDSECARPFNLLKPVRGERRDGHVAGAEAYRLS